MATQAAMSILMTMQGKRYYLSLNEETVIGSSGCAVMLSKPGVLARQARIIIVQNQYWIEALGVGVHLNGQSLTTRTQLRDGDMLTIATEQLTFHQGTATPRNVQPARPSQASAHQSPQVTAIPVAKPVQPVPLPPHQAVKPTPQPQLPPIQPPHTFAQPFGSAAQPPLQPIPNPQPLQQPFQAMQTGNPLMLQGQMVTSLPQHMHHMGQAHVEGLITLVDGPHMEDADSNIGFLLLKIILGIFLLPLLIWRPGLISLIVMGRKDTKVPTRYLRVRDQNGQIYMVRMKGEPMRGAISQGDYVSFWGRWDNGTLKMERAFNHQINADVQLR